MTTTNASPSNTHSAHVFRLYSEYIEMPGLRLTCAQTQRLCGLDQTSCLRALESLVETGFLRRTDAGQYVRLTEGRDTTPPLRMAKAVIRGTAQTGRIAS